MQIKQTNSPGEEIHGMKRGNNENRKSIDSGKRSTENDSNQGARKCWYISEMFKRKRQRSNGRWVNGAQDEMNISIVKESK